MPGHYNFEGHSTLAWQASENDPHPAIWQLLYLGASSCFRVDQVERILQVWRVCSVCQKDIITFFFL